MADYLIVPGAQLTLPERRYIRTAAAAYNRTSAVIVNIGIMWGGTLWCLRDGAPYAHLYGVDIAPDKWKIADRENLHVKIIQGDSRTLEFDKSIDVLLIDGDHHYATVRDDIANWMPRVKKGGVALFHDYKPTAHNLKQFPELEGVQRATDEWFETQVGWIELKAVDSLRAFKYG